MEITNITLNDNCIVVHLKDGRQMNTFLIKRTNGELAEMHIQSLFLFGPGGAMGLKAPLSMHEDIDGNLFPSVNIEYVGGKGKKNVNVETICSINNLDEKSFLIMLMKAYQENNINIWNKEQIIEYINSL